MARMSIDDKFLRDPRVTQLAIDLGVSRWEVMGRLLAVFAVCYDLERDILPAAQVDMAAERPAFADAMFAVDLAVNTRRGMRIRGAKTRIEYLAPKREAGRQGGIKSGESRRNSAKQKRENREASVNPPDPVPDPVPDLVPDPVPEISDPPTARAIAPTAASAAPAPPPPERGDLALRHRQALRAAIWSELAAAREAVATELGLPAGDRKLLAFDRGEEALAMRLLGARDPAELKLIAQQARHAIAVIAAEARESKSVQWLTGSVFESDRAWRRAAGRSLEEVGRKPAAPRPRRKLAASPHLQVSSLTPEERLALAAESRARLYGTTDAIPDELKP